jgi:hypothetical protein
MVPYREKLFTEAGKMYSFMTKSENIRCNVAFPDFKRDDLCQIWNDFIKLRDENDRMVTDPQPVLQIMPITPKGYFFRARPV